MLLGMYDDEGFLIDGYDDEETRDRVWAAIDRDAAEEEEREFRKEGPYLRSQCDALGEDFEALVARFGMDIWSIDAHLGVVWGDKYVSLAERNRRE
jgi:hypothetical protein